MSEIAILGTGAFGTALALALAKDGTPVSLWGRDTQDLKQMRDNRTTGRALPGRSLPPSVTLCDSIPDAAITLIAVPAQRVSGFLSDHRATLDGRVLISCAKGIEKGTGRGPVDVIRAALPSATAGCLTGPSFAVDIAAGLPTALVLAADESVADLQTRLTRPALRIYRTDDVTGAELGGALKNVIALAAGMTEGAGLGDSARAAVIARGFAEAQRYAIDRGARPETLQGLSGLGDLVLTCTSPKSRNFAAGLTLDRGGTLPVDVTVEGVATARALAEETAGRELEMPLAQTVALVAEGRMTLDEAISALLSRPAGKE